MTEHITSWRDIARDGDRPCIVVGNQLIRGPCPWNLTVVDEAGFIDLEELERGLVDGGTISITGCEIVEDRTMVGVWPDSP